MKSIGLAGLQEEALLEIKNKKIVWQGFNIQNL